VKPSSGKWCESWRWEGLGEPPEMREAPDRGFLFGLFMSATHPTCHDLRKNFSIKPKLCRRLTDIHIETLSGMGGPSF
jgi:hypothetical protein